MPTLTMTVELSDEAYQTLMALPAPEREEWSANVINSYAVAPNRQEPPVKKIDRAAMTGPEAVARLERTFAAMDAIPDDENALSHEELMANLNESRRLEGQEPLF